MKDWAALPAAVRDSGGAGSPLALLAQPSAAGCGCWRAATRCTPAPLGEGARSLRSPGCRSGAVFVTAITTQKRKAIFFFLQSNTDFTPGFPADVFLLPPLRFSPIIYYHPNEDLSFWKIRFPFNSAFIMYRPFGFKPKESRR